jgi:hypothetical protein
MREALVKCYSYLVWMVLHPINAFRFFVVQFLGILNGGRPLWSNKAMHPLLHAMGYREPSSKVDDLPYVLTITTFPISGEYDIEIAGRSIDEDGAKDTLKIRLDFLVEDLGATKHHITHEDDGRVMVHTEKWSKVYEIKSSR